MTCWNIEFLTSEWTKNCLQFYLIFAIILFDILSNELFNWRRLDTICWILIEISWFIQTTNAAHALTLIKYVRITETIEFEQKKSQKSFGNIRKIGWKAKTHWFKPFRSILARIYLYCIYLKPRLCIRI